MSVPKISNAICPARNAVIYEKNLLEFWRKAFTAIDRTKDEPMQTHLALKRVLADEERAAQADKVGHTLNMILLPVVSSASRKLVTLQTLRRMRTLKIELLKYRLAHNAFPDTLQSFDTTTTTDPFNSKSLRYRREGKGFRLWSIGENLIDDGGKTKVGDNKRADIVTTYP